MYKLGKPGLLTSQFVLYPVKPQGTPTAAELMFTLPRAWSGYVVPSHSGTRRPLTKAVESKVFLWAGLFHLASGPRKGPTKRFLISGLGGPGCWLWARARWLPGRVS